jgi:hypothetical protein
MVQMISQLFWDVTQHRLVDINVSGQPIGSILTLENGTGGLT